MRKKQETQESRKRKRTEKRKKRDTFSKITISFEIHSVRNIVRDSAVYIIISFEKGLLLEESILTKVCYWVSSRLCTGLSFCANQGVFLNPS